MTTPQNQWFAQQSVMHPSQHFFTNLSTRYVVAPLQKKKWCIRFKSKEYTVTFDSADDAMKVADSLAQPKTKTKIQ